MKKEIPNIKEAAEMARIAVYSDPRVIAANQALTKAGEEYEATLKLVTKEYLDLCFGRKEESQ